MKFLVVGAYALAAHGRPRYTGDFDVFVEPTIKNAERLCAVLVEFGFVDSASHYEQFCRPEDGKLRGIQLGFEPNRIDVFSGLSGVTFQEGWQGRLRGQAGDHPVNFISRDAFLKNKLASGRPQDLVDHAQLTAQPSSSKKRRSH